MRMELSDEIVVCERSFPGTQINTMKIPNISETAYTDRNMNMTMIPGFYEGRESCFSLEPDELADIIEVREM